MFLRKLKKIFYWTVIFILSATNFLNAGEQLLDDFEYTNLWKPANANGVKFSLSSDKGFKGKSLCFDFDFTKARGYVIAGKDVSIMLPENYEFSFYVKGLAKRNTAIEFKLIDKLGNTYWRKIFDFSFPKNWEKISISKDEIVFAWGPGDTGEIKEVKRIEIVISTENESIGKVFIDELSLTELPKTTLSMDLNKIRVESSADENDKFSVKQALDNNMRTRWSSPYSDPQWLKIDFGEVTELSGLIIYWEAGFGLSYDVMLSSDDKNYTTACSIEDGDGESDYIIFKRQKARYLKLFGRKRGTAWGYSIYEIKFFTGDFQPEITVSSNNNDKDNMLDGNTKTVWVSDNKNIQNFVLDLKGINTIGGLNIYLDNTTITHRRISTSDDNKTWKEIFSSKKKVSTVECYYFSKTINRFLKIEMKAGNGPISIKEITFKGKDEQLTPRKSFEIAAMQSPKGFYPLWLSKQQEYWTIIGTVDDDKETLISEYGTVEPWHRSHTFTPIIKISETYRGDKIITYRDVDASQFLEDDYLPIPKVVWKGKEIDLEIQAFVADAGQKSSTYLKYTVKNKLKGNLKGKFYLLLRPFQLNPPWMGGGLADINTIKYNSKIPSDRSPTMLMVNDKNALFVPCLPDEYGTSTFDRKDGYGDIIEDINGATLGGNIPEFKDNNNLGSSALGYLYDLKAGENKSFYFIIPLHDKDNEIDAELAKSNIENYFDTKKSAVKNFWQKKLGEIKIELPDKEFVDTLKSNIAYVLLNDDKNRLQPGSRNYEASWMRDGAVTSTALLSMGLNEEVKRYLNWITGFVQNDGWVPFIVDSNDKITTNNWKEFDSQGEYIYAIFQYYLFTKDKKFLEEKKEKIASVINFIKARRNERKTEKFKNTDKKEFYGIFPESQSHEGYIDPPRHSYWDNFWGLRGLNDAVNLFKILGDEEKSRWADSERKDFQKCVYESIELVTKKKNINFIPGCAELGDGDPTSTANGLWPCNETKNMPQEKMKATFEMYWNELTKRFNKEWKGGFTPYELRNANPFILLGQRIRLSQMLNKFFEWKRPRKWNHWAEVVTSDERLPQYLGDMPHTWVGAEYVNVVRNMLILEDGDILYLGKGLLKEWFESGKKISVTEMPTHFGKISYTIEPKILDVLINVSGKIFDAKKIIFVVPPIEEEISNVRINGKIYENWKTGEIILKELPAEIVINKVKI